MRGITLRGSLGAILAALVALGIVLTVFAAPGVSVRHRPHAATPATSQPSAKPTKPVNPLDNYCPGGKPGPIIYFADKPIAASEHAMGPPLDPSENALVPNRYARPRLRVVVQTWWYRACHDPAFARVQVAAAYPHWKGLRGPFDWASALRLLTRAAWHQAHLVWHNRPPTVLTFMMVSHPGSPPSIFITPAPSGGWYLDLIFGHNLVEDRTECGGQPALHIPGFHAILLRLFRLLE